LSEFTGTSNTLRVARFIGTSVCRSFDDAGFRFFRITTTMMTTMISNKTPTPTATPIVTVVSTLMATVDKDCSRVNEVDDATVSADVVTDVAVIGFVAAVVVKANTDNDDDDDDGDEVRVDDDDDINDEETVVAASHWLKSRSQLAQFATPQHFLDGDDDDGKQNPPTPE
jgi:hypothetical protein